MADLSGTKRDEGIPRKWHDNGDGTWAEVVYSGAAAAGGATEAKQDTGNASLSVLDDWDESDRAKVNPIVGQAGVEAGAGPSTAKTVRVVQASDGPSVSALGATTDVEASGDGSIIAILKRIRGFFKAEDTAHVSGDFGLPLFGVINANGSVMATEGDYAPLATDIRGYVQLGTGVSAASPVKTEDNTLAASTALMAIGGQRTDTPAVQTSAEGDAGFLQQDANGALWIAGSQIEDAPHTSGDRGVAMLGVRNDSSINLAGTDLDYTPLSVAAGGILKVFLEARSLGSSFVRPEDDPLVSAGAVGLVGGQRQDTDTTQTSASGDAGWLIQDARGHLLMHRRNLFSRISTAATTTVKTGVGTVTRIVVGVGGVGSTATIYDNTAGSGTVIAVIDTAAVREINLDAGFATGLTIVTAGGTPADLTVIYS